MKNEAPRFTDTIAQNYQRYLVPILFDAYAADLAARVSLPDDGAVLEVACGTGVATGYLRAALPKTVRLVASDLNSNMLEVAASVLNDIPGIEFETADGGNLPFGADTFDTVVCQFGVMFFPDKAGGFAEVARVLKPGGQFLFSVWDTLDHNPVTKLIHKTILDLSPDDPADFLSRPHGYCDLMVIKRELEAAGFGNIDFHVQQRESCADSAKHIVMGLVAGGPLSAELEERGLTDRARTAVEAVLRQAYGDGPVHAPMQAIIVNATT